MRSPPWRHFDRANEQYPIVRQSTLGDDTRKLDVYSAVADACDISLADCYHGMYADLDANKRLVRLGDVTADGYDEGDDGTGSATTLTGNSDEGYARTTLGVDWLLTRYNLALAQAGLYDATELRIRVWDHRVYSAMVDAIDYQERVFVVIRDEVDKLVETAGDDILYTFRASFSHVLN